MDDKKSSDLVDIYESVLEETLWMARRYADGRATYAPSMFNECIEKLDKAGKGHLMKPDVAGNEGTRFASDRSLGKWVGGKFEKE